MSDSCNCVNCSQLVKDFRNVLYYASLERNRHEAASQKAIESMATGFPTWISSQHGDDSTSVPDV